MPLTGRGAGVLALGVALAAAGVATGHLLVAGIGTAFVLAVAAETAAVLRPLAVTVERRVEPPVVRRHGRCTAHVRLRHRPPGPLVRLRATDRVDQHPTPVPLTSEPGEAGAGEVGADAPGGSRASYAVPTPRRGVVRVGPLRLERSGVLGLAHRVEETEHVDTVRVLPRAVPLTAVPWGTRRSASGAVTGPILGGTDLVGLHEYVPGDDLRRLHPATSARTGVLMVREDSEPSAPALTVLLDDRAASYAGPSTGPAGDEPFEEAVELAAAVCALAAEHGHDLRLATLTGAVHLEPADTHGAPDLVETAFVDVAVVEGPAGIHDAIRRDVRPHDVVVAVTGAQADRLELDLLAEQGVRGAVLVAGADPAIEATAGAVRIGSTTSDDVAAAWDRVVPW